MLLACCECGIYITRKSISILFNTSQVEGGVYEVSNRKIPT